MALALQIVSLAVFTFGAPAFSVLAFSYWRQGYRGSVVFRIFTVLCAAAFLGSLASIAVPFDYPAANIARALLAGLLPPLMAHLVLEQECCENRRVPGGKLLWKVLLSSLYLAAILSALAAQGPWSDALEGSSQLVLGAASLFTVALLLTTRRGRSRAEARQRGWNLVIFGTLLLTTVASFVSDNTFFNLIPDYLLLLFFAVRLYYTERLAFFDMFVKGGSFFVAGTTLLALVLLVVPPFRRNFAGDWMRAWLGIVALMPVWLFAPLLYSRISRWIDRALHRKYSAIEAERLFVQAGQASRSEAHLRGLAVDSLEDIFRCHAEVTFDSELGPPMSDQDLAIAMAPVGRVMLIARENQIPFLSEDRRLLETLAATLGVLLQNVRLRSQQQEQLRREQELAALASRAELRALRAQINPHFLFNALNAIAGWIRTEPEFADDTVAQLAEVFRYTLRRSQNEWVQMHEEIAFIRAYLAVEHARFGDRLYSHVSISPAANMISIPAMVIQPLIENAIKHGVSKAGAVGRVRLDARLLGPDLRIEVSDNGPGFPSSFALDGPGDGHGLRNVADRLKGYYGERGTLRWENTASGSRVTIEIASGARS